MILSLALLLASRPIGDVEASIAKLAASDGLTVSFVDREMGGVTRTWTLKLQKPDLISAEGTDQGIVVDGRKIVTYETPLRNVKTSPRSESAWEELLSRPDMLVAKLFFDPQGAWLQTAKPGGIRAKNGVTLTGTKFTISPSMTAILFVNSSEKTIELVQVESKQGTEQSVHVIDKLLVSPAQHAPSVFVYKEAVEFRGDHLISVPSEASRRDAAEGFREYRVLSWDDFQVRDDPPPGLSAWTQSFIRYGYKSSWKRSGNGFLATLTSLEIRSGFDQNRMWRKATFNGDSSRLLSHEQGHLDINEIEARKLRRLSQSDWPVGFGQTTGAAEDDLARKLKRLIDDAIATVSRLNKEYDADTDHGRNAAAQARWSAKLKSQL